MSSTKSCTGAVKVTPCAAQSSSSNFLSLPLDDKKCCIFKNATPSKACHRCCSAAYCHTYCSSCAMTSTTGSDWPCLWDLGSQRDGDEGFRTERVREGNAGGEASVCAKEQQVSQHRRERHGPLAWLHFVVVGRHQLRSDGHHLVCMCADQPT